MNKSIKSRFKPSMCGVGYMGIGKYKSKDNGKHTLAYAKWSDMMQRCYSKKYHAKRPTYIGCTVCEEWHNFQVFAAWVKGNYPKDGNSYALDKDIKVKGNKVYSPESCMFVSLADNNIGRYGLFGVERFAVSPLGVKHSFYNLADFCIGKDLHKGHMSDVLNGKRRQHKGWTSSNLQGDSWNSKV